MSAALPDSEHKLLVSVALPDSEHKLLVSAALPDSEHKLHMWDQDTDCV